MAGIRDVAKAAGVSISTVSNVLNGKRNVGDETKEKVMRICEELSYYPNMAGKTLKKGNSKTILFNFSDFDRTFFLKIINGISDYANEHDYDFIISTSKSCEKYMRSTLTAGCISLDSKMSNETLLRAASENYPIVVLDRMLHNPYIKTIVTNNYDPMSQLIQRVVDCGYRKFAFIGGIESTDDNKERYKAFRDVLEKNHISFKRENYYAGDYREKSGYRAAKIIMLSERLPEALICANDNMAIGAIKAFRENGIRVPEDIAVTGFDNTDMSRNLELTTVDVPNYERGYLAAQYLVENIEGKRNVELFRISAQVKWRKTVGSKMSKK